MRTSPALRTLAAALLTCGTFVAAAAGTTAAAATPPTHADGHGSPIWGTVVSRTPLNVREAPTTKSPVVERLSPGTQDRVKCMVRGQKVNGNPDWYWLVGAQGWASAAFVDTGGRSVPTCADPCPHWKNGGWHNPDWNDPAWHETWAVTVSVSWSISGSWG